MTIAPLARETVSDKKDKEDDGEDKDKEDNDNGGGVVVVKMIGQLELE